MPYDTFACFAGLIITHSWLVECLEIYGAEENTMRFLKNTILNWKAILTSSGTRLAEVNYQKRDLPRILTLSIVAMISMTRVLARMEVGYQLKKRGSRINHLMFMDDIKLFGRGNKEIDTLVQTVRTVSGDIRMEFGIEKCSHVNIQRGKVKMTEGIQLPGGNNIKDEGEDRKGIYIKRLKAILKSKLNSGNTVKAIVAGYNKL